MRDNDPRKHHYAPKFFLKNFAVDENRKRVTTLAKDGTIAVWADRSIESLGYEEDFYVHMERGVPVCVESDINRRIETPITQSDTWEKITSGRTDLLDQGDRAILYALIRHLEARTPHFQATISELSQMSAEMHGDIPFSDEERQYYAAMRSDPAFAKAFLNHLAATQQWSEESFRGSLIMVARSPIALRSSTTPVLSIRAPEHCASHLPLPGKR